MENQSERTAKTENGDFGKYPCRWCGRFDVDDKTWISTSRFTNFIALIDHLIYNHFEDVRRWNMALQKQRENPFEVNLFEKTYFNLRNTAKPVAAAKQFLPSVADWLEPALASIPDLNLTKSGDILVAIRLKQQVIELSGEFREQRDYVVEYKEALQDAVTDPKWPRRLGQQSRFVADSLAGAKWRYKASSSREFIRKERPKLKSEIPSGRKENRWWEAPLQFKPES